MNSRLSWTTPVAAAPCDPSPAASAPAGEPAPAVESTPLGESLPADGSDPGGGSDASGGSDATHAVAQRVAAAIATRRVRRMRASNHAPRFVGIVDLTACA